MSWLSSIFNPATGTPSNAGGATHVPASLAPQQSAAQTAPATSHAANPAVPAETKPTSPLDSFVPLWQTPTTSDGKPAPIPVDPLTQPIFNLDPAKITETANRMDFTAGISPELATKALGGDVASLMELINTSTRQAVVAMTMQSGQLTNQALLANNQRITSQLPQQITKAQLMHMEDENPAMSHPAAQPLVNSLKQMFFAKDPTASPAAIAKQVSDYLKGFSVAIADSDPANVQAAKIKTAEATDWMGWVDRDQAISR